MDYSDQHIDYISPAAAEPETVYKTNRDLNLAHRLIEETGCNLFLTGRAGTGKTTFLRHLRKTSSKRMVVLAPTGVAAINAEGSTIHSFFQLSFSPFIPGKGFISSDRRNFNFSRTKKRIIAALDLLVIDEISMVRPDVLDAIDSVLRRYRDPGRPFGGVQLLLIGDLRQLAPVVRDDEWQHLSPYYSSPYFFESHALRESGYMAIELSTIYRQTDSRFIDILNAIRDGYPDAGVLQTLNSRYIPNFTPDEKDGYIRLTTHNWKADEVNFRNLAKLPGDSVTFEARISGNFPDSSYPAEQLLVLKPGAKVMFIKNDSGEERKFFNGMLGTISAINEDTVTVIPDNGAPPVVAERMEWENTRFEVDPDTAEITTVTDGVFSQLPLRLAWAITIHKSQGLTFDRAIVDAQSSFAPGQTYVALSRCRSLEGLVLEQPLSISSVITDGKVNSFIAAAESLRPDDDKISRMSAEFLRTSLADLFSFRTIRYSFDEYYRYIREYVLPIYGEYVEPFLRAEKIMKEEVEAVGDRFVALYASGPIDPDRLPEERAYLDKIRSGCRYFYDKLNSVLRIVDGVEVSLGNDAYVQRLTNTYDAIMFMLRMRMFLLSELAEEDFSIRSYTNAKAHAAIRTTEKSAEKQKTRKVTKEKKQKGQKKPVGYSRLESLKLLKQGMTIEDIAEARSLTPSTISNHLVSFFPDPEAGERKFETPLTLEDILTTEQIERCRQEYHPDESATSLIERLKDDIPSYRVMIYVQWMRLKPGHE